MTIAAYHHTLVSGLLLAATLGLAAGSSRAQDFTEIAGAGLQAVQLGSVTWADFDSDGDLDALVTGRDAVATPATRLYRNNGSGSFTQVATGFIGVEFSSAAWADYDNDGDMDVVVIGEDDLDVPITRLYRNDGGSFTTVSAGFQGIKSGTAAWADFDNDGDSDLVLTGRHDAGTTITRLYRNDGGTFADIGGGLPALDNAGAGWGDFDADGDLDLALCGLDATSAPITRVYRSDAGVFTDIGAGLTGVERGALAWADYDGDGDLDLAYCGASASGNVTKLYRNDGLSGFTSISIGLPGTSSGSMEWGDYDGDGDPDLLLTGSDNTLTRLTIVARNDAGSFTDIAAGLDGVRNSSARWADIDNDSRLDLAITGQTASGTPVAKVFHNNTPTANTAPGGPSGLSVALTGNTATLSWTPGSDAQTPTAALSYVIRVGLTPGGTQILGPEADPATGLRRVVRQGFVTGRTSWTLRLPTLGTYYWSVQAVDAAHAGSAFAGEASFATAFTDWPYTVTGVSNSALAWGDFDGDRDLDLIVTGNSAFGRMTKLYRNNAGVFSDTGYSFANVDQGAVAWGDYDRDGDLDLVLTGMSASGRIGRVYRNTGAGFADVGAAIDPVSTSAAAWGDYDSDGDLDLLLAGYADCCGPILRLYRNTTGVFTNVAGYTGLEHASVAWGDYDNDGRLDFAVSGLASCCGPLCQIYRNSGSGSFSDIGAPLVGLQRGSVAWGDYDSDGDLDLLTSGTGNSGRLTRIYTNFGGSFSAASATFAGVQQGTAAFCDFNHDGDLDVAVMGLSDAGKITRMYQNVHGTFSDTAAGLEGFDNGCLVWGDLDADQDADVVLTGLDVNATPRVRFYKNSASLPNTPPNPPGSLSATSSNLQLTLSWAAATDGQTPASALQYNVRVGTTPGGAEIVSAMADAATGTRYTAGRGNSDLRRTLQVQLPQLGTYYWSVQTIDGSRAASSFASEQVYSTPFGEGPVVEGVYRSSVVWADYDNDGDLDLAIAGLTSSVGQITRIYRNTADSFSDVGANLTGVYYAALAWGDYDNDGDLDLAMCGLSSSFGPITRIYRNNGGAGFADIGASLEGVYIGALAWGDYDNDGDLDLVVTGNANCCGQFMRLYRNTGGVFNDAAASGLSGIYNSAVVWADIDNDRDLDLIASGSPTQTRIYRNNGGGSFTDINSTLVATYSGGLSCGDYDNDGDQDILLTGQGHYARVYRNSGNGSFTDIGAGLEPVYSSNCAWGDYDNDGDLDALISGYSGSYGPITRIYTNTNGVFADLGATLDGAYDGSAAWGDYDNDGDLDLVTTGQGGQQFTHIYRNNLAGPANTAPSAPSNLQVQVVGTQATLSWSPAADAQSPAAGLTYNLRVGSSPGGSQLVAPMANTATGYRRIVQNGSTGSNTSWALNLTAFPVTATLYFSVQAVDGAFAGSPFSAEAVFSGAPILQSVKDVRNDQGRRVRVKWQRSIYDSQSSSTVIASYALWRRVGPYKADASASERNLARAGIGSPPPGIATPPGSWDYVLSLPAHSDPTYSVVASTLCDSTSTGICQSVFFVSAISTNPQVFFDSAPDSGYSVDNLSPATPQNLAITALQPVQVSLGWTAVLDTDRDHYAVYRADEVAFQPGPRVRVASTVGPTFTDGTITPGERYYYWVTAVDFSGNESPLSNLVIVSNGTTDTADHSVQFRLAQNSPNPFNPTTHIVFELDAPARARLTVFGPDGRRIAEVLDGELPAGPHTYTWDARDARGNPLPSGAYWYELLAGSKRATRKMILVR